MAHQPTEGHMLVVFCNQNTHKIYKNITLSRIHWRCGPKQSLLLQYNLRQIPSVGACSTSTSKWIWVGSRNCDCLVTWFCYQLIAKPDNKTATVPWPDPYAMAKQGPTYQEHSDGLVLDCSNSSAIAMELLQSCTKPLIYIHIFTTRKSSRDIYSLHCWKASNK